MTARGWARPDNRTQHTSQICAYESGHHVGTGFERPSDYRPIRGKYPSVGNPIKLSASPSDVTRSPLLGEHTDEILRQVLGFSDHQVAEIHDSGALDPPRKQAAE
jgi:hypothetical protein